VLLDSSMRVSLLLVGSDVVRFNNGELTACGNRSV
jgi:hypothetical protein